MSKVKMSIEDAFAEIINYSHFWNWAPDWQITQEIYFSIPNSYSVLTPFAYSYIEELIRTRTSDYGIELRDKNGLPRKSKVGIGLINLAIQENKHNDQEFIKLLEELKLYFSTSKSTDKGNNRNSVAHGYMHPRFWSQESFENLIIDIARLSKFGAF